MVQIALPASDVAAGSWIIGGTAPAATFWQSMNEGVDSPDDETTYAQNPLTDVSETILKVGLSAIQDPHRSDGHTIRARVRRGTASLAAVYAELREAGSLIATLNAGVTSSYANYSHTLSAAEADAITPAGYAGGLELWLTKRDATVPPTLPAPSVLMRVTACQFEAPSEIHSAATLFDLDLAAAAARARARVDSTILDLDLAHATPMLRAAVHATLLDLDAANAHLRARASSGATLLDLDLALANPSARAAAAATIIDFDRVQGRTSFNAAVAQFEATILDLDMALGVAGARAAVYATLLDADALGVGPGARKLMQATLLDLDMATSDPSALPLLFAGARMSHARALFIADSAQAEFVHNR